MMVIQNAQIVVRQTMNASPRNQASHSKIRLINSARRTRNCVEKTSDSSVSWPLINNQIPHHA